MKEKAVKVPVVMQMEALECGAASLCMILAYYGKWLPLEQVRADCGVSRDGSSAKNVLKAARSYGLKAQGYRYEPEQLRRQARFPCIIHWKFNHFVVLCGFQKSRVRLNDPARGAITVTLEEFDQAFTGIVLQFEPTQAFQPGGKPRSVLAFARDRLRGAGAAFAFVFLTGALSSVLGVVSPAFSRVFLDRILTRADPGWLYPFLLLLGGVAAAQIILSLLNVTYLLKLQGKFAIVANSTFLWHVLRLPMEFFSQRMAGDIAARQNSNEGIAATLIQQLAPVLLNFIMLVLYFVVMLRYSPLLTLVGLASVAANLVLARVISQKRTNITRVQMRDAGKLTGSTMSGIEMIETIKASGAENGFFQRWAGYQASVNAQGVKFARLNQYLGALPGLVQQLCSGLVLLLGVFLVIQGEFTPGMILAFQGFLNSFLAPASSLISVGQSVQEMRTSMERIEDVMHYQPDVEYGPEPAEGGWGKLSGRLELRHVTFGYSRLADPLIRDFSLTLEPGQRVAFVGPSGCGKSTLSKLISGLYKPWSGEILFDGKPIAQIPRSVFTGSLAVVDQDIILFEDTVAANIKMWDSSIEDFEMILAARDAHIHEDIMLREGGYQRRILEGGKDLSGGQRQRLEIARVLAQDPTILIMDEATSALDARTEYEVVRSIRDRGVTCIVVAHRLSTVRDCDEIVVLERGRVVERGTHETLYRAGGLYASLVSNE